MVVPTGLPEATTKRPEVHSETSLTQKTEEKGSARRPEPQPGCSGWNPSPVAWAGGQPAQGGTEESRRPCSGRDDGAADVTITITSSADERDRYSLARATPQGD